MRTSKVAIIACIVVWPAGWAGAERTPWELYLEEPTPKHAHAVASAEYHGQLAKDAESARLERDLAILEREVVAGEAESIFLAFRIDAQFPNSGARSEFISEIVGRGIRSNPTAYLSAVRRIGGNCVGVHPSGDFFVDREPAKKVEGLARIKALEKVADPALRNVRKTCLDALATYRREP